MKLFNVPLRLVSAYLFAPCATLCVMVALTSRAYALQPLEAFIASAQRANPDNQQAVALARQRAAQNNVARAPYLPSLTAQSTYTRNEYQVTFDLAPGRSTVVTPQNALDAYVTLAVPLINVGAWAQQRAASLNAKAAEASRERIALSVEADVVRAYYQLIGTEAVLSAANTTVAYAEHNTQNVRDRYELGVASELDLQRAIADVARAQQDLAVADRDVSNARRSLESVSRLTPEPTSAADYTDSGLDEEAPLASWLDSASGDLPSVRSAALTTSAARATRDAARAALLPTISAQAQEHFTNTGVFTGGRSHVYTVTATAMWRFDFGLLPNVSAQNAALAGAAASEDKARRAADDAIFNAWQDVRAGIARARAARVQMTAADLAIGVANERYAQGSATQLEVVQTQRDFFSAAVSRAQADADLVYARAFLRLVSRRSGAAEVKP